MKKFISLFLAVVMAFSFMVPAFAADAEETTTTVVEEESETAKGVFELIWETIKKCIPSFKNIFKNFIAFINSLFESDEPEEPTTETPTTEEPTTEEPTTEEPTTEEPTTEEPATEEPTTEEPTTEESTTEESTTEEPTTAASAKLIIAINDGSGTPIDILTIDLPVGTEITSDYVWSIVTDAGYEPWAGVYADDFTFGDTAQLGVTYNASADT